MSNKERKRERRKQRHERNIRREVEHKREAWENGKLIEENHNNGPYSEGYAKELGKRLCDILDNNKLMCLEDGGEELFVIKYRLLRIKIRDYILHYPPGLSKDCYYTRLKRSIETYWDEPEKLFDLW